MFGAVIELPTHSIPVACACTEVIDMAGIRIIIVFRNFGTIALSLKIDITKERRKVEVVFKKICYFLIYQTSFSLRTYTPLPI